MAALDHKPPIDTTQSRWKGKGNKDNRVLVKFRTTSDSATITTLSTLAKPLQAITTWATAHILRKRHTTIITTHTVKREKAKTHTQGKGKGHQPQTNSPGGEGHDSNSITTPETSKIVNTNTKRGWVSLSIPICLRTTKA
ncbi:unnamed protein product [Lactuca saligna]|uniref:Uncharacterized protein n=1 Tax=Lactuca saligna TaxID=75948 RepID=A0AA35YUQ0_LACSI|nr:unnamed protein product [Lactuca saligna]